MKREEAENWVEAGKFSDLDPEYPTLAQVGAIEVALCRLGDRVFAIGNECTHANARLSDGIIDGSEIFCPLHQGSFDIRTGQAVALPCEEPVAAYAVKVEDGRVFVDIDQRPGD
jgi:naphthalene 1,2-dioxygenase ferredoxin component